MTERGTREPRSKKKAGGRKKPATREEPDETGLEPEGSPVEVRRGPEQATPENPLEFRYVLTFKPRRYRGKNWTGTGRSELKPVHRVAAKQRKRKRR